MAVGLTGIIAQNGTAESRHRRALTALRNIEGSETPALPPSSSTPATRKGGMTPEGRKRVSAALRKRWAANASPRRCGDAGVKRTAAQAKKRGRNDNDFSSRYPAIAKALAALPDNPQRTEFVYNSSGLQRFDADL